MNILTVKNLCYEIVLYISFAIGITMFALLDINPKIGTALSILNTVCLGIIFLIEGFIVYKKRNKINFKQLLKPDSLKKWISIFVVLFFIFNLATILLNPNKLGNIKIMVSTVTQLIILSLMFPYNKKTMERFVKVYMFSIFAFTVVSFIFYIYDMKLIIFLGRYCGVFLNPNIASILMGISFVLSIFMIYYQKKIRVNLINLLVLTPMIQLGGSRATKITLMTILFVFFAIEIYQKNKKNVFFKKFGITATVILIAFFTLLPLSYQGLKLMHDELIVDTKPITDSNYKRDDKETEESDMARFELIKSGLKAVKENPVFGVGFHNVYDAVSEQSDEKLGGLLGGGVHNTYLEVMISNGLTGFICFFMIVFMLILSAGKRCIIEKHMSKNLTVVTSILLGLCVYGLFEANLILTTSIMAVIFWFVIGVYIYEYSK